MMGNIACNVVLETDGVISNGTNLVAVVSIANDYSNGLGPSTSTNNL